MSRFAVFLISLAACLNLAAAVDYHKPPKEVMDVLHAPAPPLPSVSPSKAHLLLMDRRLYPSIDELAAPVLRIAGLRINPANNGPHAPTLVITGLTVKDLSTLKETRIAVPPGARLTVPNWSPDGKRFAVANITAGAVELYFGSVDSPSLRRVPGLKLNASMGSAIDWLGGSNELLVRAVPAGRGPAPQTPAAPSGPNVQESAGQSGPVRTYQDMLSSPHDEALFDYYCSSQLTTVNFTTMKQTPVGKPALFAATDPAPDGKHILVGLVERPYSYVHTFSSFPRQTLVWDLTGKSVYTVHKRGLSDRVPIEGVATGPRNINWRPTEPATLLWWEALDGGNPRTKVPHRDKLMMVKAPFTSPVEVTKTVHRAMGLMHGEGGLAMVTDMDRDRRWITVNRIYLDDRNAEAKTVWSRSIQDRYANPGMPLMRTLPTGGSVMHQSGDFVFLRGEGASPQGDRPFLDRMSLKTWQTERLFRAGEKGYESVVSLLSADGSKFLTSYEDPLTPPNLMVRTAGQDNSLALTKFTDPTPQLRGITQRLVKYNRPDGVQLSFTLFLPPGYKEGTRLPTVLYAYPLEYNDPDTAGQIGGSTQRFVQMRGASHLFLLLSGYAILNNATIPIIGDPETVNNTYIEQLVSGAKAAIDKAAELGVTDPARVAVTGHSYGGFMTANLLAHSDLFRTGVARSGAYNRTLTPFGFQSERRTFWQARDVYMKMSPFTWADKINEPLLLIHGEADNNPGTFPVQSERLYQAVRGNGGTVRLVMLPHESHGYAARESLEHVLWETVTWLDRYVKNAKESAKSN